MTGAAVVITDDGYLVTSAQNLTNRVEIVLPNGKVRRPVRVASDPMTGIILLKVSADRLVPVRFGAGSIASGAQVFATGFDAARSDFGQIGGLVTRGDQPSATPPPLPATIETNIGFTQGFSGGAVSDTSGAVIGLIVGGHSTAGSEAISAIPMRYVMDWIAGWQEGMQGFARDGDSWPELSAANLLSLHYPSGWSVSETSKTANSYLAEITPNDPDVPAQLSLSVRPTNFTGDPLDFAVQQFGDQPNAAIWGAVSYGQMPGVRVLIDQEGARFDVVYLFVGRYLIGLSLSAGYSISDTGAQAQRMTAIFEAVLRSILITSGD